MSVSTGEAIGAALIAGAGAEATGITDFTPIGRSGEDNKDDPGSPASGIQTALAALSGQDAGSSVSEALIGQLADAARSGGTRIIERQVREIGNQQGALPNGIQAAITDNTRGDPQQPQVRTQTDNSNQSDGNGLWSNAVRNVGYGIGNTPFALAGGAIDAGVDAGNDSRRWLANNDPTTDSDDTGLLSSARRNIDRIAGSVGITNDPMPGYLGSSSANSYSSNSTSSSSSGGSSGSTSFSDAVGGVGFSGGSSGGNDSGGNDSDTSDSGGSSYGSTNPYSSNSGGNDSGGNDSGGGGGLGGAVSDAADSVSDAVGGLL